MPLHVAVDARFAVLDERGIGRYARAIVAELLREPGVRLSFVVPGVLAGGRRRRVAQVLGVDRAQVAGRIPHDARVTFNLSNGTDLDTSVPQVTMVHDATPFAFPAPDARVRAREQAPFLRTARRARIVLAQSHFTAAEVERWLAVPPERIVVAPLGYDAAFRGGPANPPAALRGRRYILHVGAHDERKNTHTLLDGYAAAFPDGDPAIVFTHRPPRLPRGAIAIERPDDAALVELYRGALLVAVPSTYEGFGLPLLEAMACGTPALAARAAALPEVGGDACAYVDAPRDPQAWALALRGLASDAAARAALSATGPGRAAQFSWSRCAAITIDALRSAAA